MSQVNKRMLAETLGVSERTLTEWQKEPSFPMEVNGGRGSENLYETSAVIAWMVEREVSRRAGEKARDRLDRLKADMVELELAERLGQLAPAAMFEAAWTDHIIGAKTELLTMPHRLVSEILALYGVAVDPDLVTKYVEESCLKLEKFDVDIDPFESADSIEDDGDRDEND